MSAPVDSSTRRTVLVTGGLGYIGSHCTIELISAGYDVVILDNMVNSKQACLKRVQQIAQRTIPFYCVDLLDKQNIRVPFEKHTIHSVIHFAALKAVGESVNLPLKYYKNNIIGTLNLLEIMDEFCVRTLIFSSSATVYGEPKALPICESHPTGNCTNTYGRTKHIVEQILRDLVAAPPASSSATAQSGWHIALLRYFNPIGCHKSGLIGEDPQGPPNNLLPYVAQVAVGRRPFVQVFGNDYATRDGTGVRDYIHVVDLVLGHVAALRKLEADEPTKSNCQVYNLGTGRGYSVMEVIKAMERASDRPIAHEMCAKRPGDTAEIYADARFAGEQLGWKAERDLDEMCEDIWRWQSANPNGFAEDTAEADTSA